MICGGAGVGITCGGGGAGRWRSIMMTTAHIGSAATTPKITPAIIAHVSGARRKATMTETVNTARMISRAKNCFIAFINVSISRFGDPDRRTRCL
jgi:hypothetical protein